MNNNFELTVNSEGKVAYMYSYGGSVVGSTTPKNSAWDILRKGVPFKSDEFEGFPIGVEVNKSQYFFAGKWEESIFDEPKVEPKVEPETEPKDEPKKRRKNVLGE